MNKHDKLVQIESFPFHRMHISVYLAVMRPQRDIYHTTYFDWLRVPSVFHWLNMEQVLNTVIVGYGMSGRQFQPHLLSKTKHMKLYGVVTRQSVEIKDVRVWTSVDEAINDPNVHVVVICTPTPSHTELAIKCLKANKHLVIGI